MEPHGPPRRDPLSTLNLVRPTPTGHAALAYCRYSVRKERETLASRGVEIPRSLYNLMSFKHFHVDRPS